MQNDANKPKSWQPYQDLLSPSSPRGSGGPHNYAVIVLNTWIALEPTVLLNLWSAAKVRITVDGGTNRWLTWLQSQEIDHAKISQPDLITGDMDSVSTTVLSTFSTSKVIQTPDQNQTDYTKALMELGTHCANNNININAVYVIAETNGRLDHILSNIHTLYKAVEILPDIDVIQVASNSLTWLLLEGFHTIQIPDELRESQEWCALIPFGVPSRVTTTGLKWNLSKDRKMQFGEMISTSNTYEGSPTVTVSTDSTIVWSMGSRSFSSATSD